MFRLYRWLCKRTKPLFVGPSNPPRVITSRRVVTVEWDEKVLVSRVWSDGELSGPYAQVDSDRHNHQLPGGNDDK